MYAVGIVSPHRIIIGKFTYHFSLTAHSWATSLTPTPEQDTFPLHTFSIDLVFDLVFELVLDLAIDLLLLGILDLHIFVLL